MMNNTTIKEGSIVKDNKTSLLYRVIACLDFCNAYIGIELNNPHWPVGKGPVCHLKEKFITLAD